jgi:hypothetical protein
MGEMMSEAHPLRRILKLCPASAPHPVGAAIDGKKAAQMAMVTTKEELEHSDQRFHKALPKGHCYIFDRSSSLAKATTNARERVASAA